jgi:hypothetical protein
LRVLLVAIAYTLMRRLKESALKNTELERANSATTCVWLLKIGATIIRNTRPYPVCFVPPLAANLPEDRLPQCHPQAR